MEAGMTRAYGLDLRERVIDAIEGGLSTRAAARRFLIGESTAGSWHRLWRETGSVEPRRQGNQGGSVLDAHKQFLLDLIEATPDISLGEMAECLESEQSLTVDPSTIWYFLRRYGITYKKRRRMPPSKAARTC